jgi:hypothetical protein
MQLLKQQPNPAWLLAAVADAARAKTSDLQAKATVVVRWLLNSLPEARLAEHPSVPAGLLTIPRIPEHLALELCKRGVRVPYAQIVAAARSGVEGEDSWAAASAVSRQFAAPNSEVTELLCELHSVVACRVRPCCTIRLI